MQAASREKTTIQVRLELVLHERWQSAPSIACLDLRQKLAEVLLDQTPVIASPPTSRRSVPRIAFPARTTLATPSRRLSKAQRDP